MHIAPHLDNSFLFCPILAFFYGQHVIFNINDVQAYIFLPER